MPKRIYIAGKVTGLPIHEVTMKFGAAQKQIEALGFIALNPLELVDDFKATWQYAMKICICHLTTANAVLLLDNWEQSKGAKIEKQLADDLEIPVFNNTAGNLKLLKYQLE